MAGVDVRIRHIKNNSTRQQAFRSNSRSLAETGHVRQPTSRQGQLHFHIVWRRLRFGSYSYCSCLFMAAVQKWMRWIAPLFASASSSRRGKIQSRLQTGVKGHKCQQQPNNFQTAPKLKEREAARRSSTGGAGACVSSTVPPDRIAQQKFPTLLPIGHYSSRVLWSVVVRCARRARRKVRYQHNK